MILAPAFPVRVLLGGLARDAHMHELVDEIAPLHPAHNTFPAEVFLDVAADALNWCQASRADPVPLEGTSKRFLPECTFRGREYSRFQYAVLTAAALSGGAEPDLLRLWSECGILPTRALGCGSHAAGQ